MTKSIVNILILSFISISSLAMTIANESNVAVVFRFHEGKYSHFINVKPGENVKLAQNLEDKLIIEPGEDDAGLFRFHEIERRYDEVFIRTDSWSSIFFIISSDEKIESMSAYRKIIIKNADPAIYNGLAIELLKKHQPEFESLLNPSECIGCSGFFLCFLDALGIDAANFSPKS